MDRPEHVESDVARIESKIRRLRFTKESFERWMMRFNKDSLERWMKWGALLGLILGTGAAVCFFLDSFAGPLKLLDDWGKITPEITTLAWAVLLVVGSVFLGFLLPALVFGLIICFRPVYVALFCDIAQFEREYGSTSEPLGRLPRRLGS
jgi:hypothetical protein